MPIGRLFALALLATLALLAGVACDDDGEPTPTPTRSTDDTATPLPTPSGNPQTGLPERNITVRSEDGGIEEQLTVELATTGDQRRIGLMFRESLDEDRGMLFLFAREQEVGRGFWMRNTYVPLTIAYLDASGRVLALEDGTPLDETVLAPGVAYHAVLEVNQGWFERHNLGLGSIVELPGDAPTPE